MPETSKETARYNAIKIRLKVFDIVFTVLYLILFQVFFSQPLKFALYSFTANFYYAFTLYLIFFSIFHYALSFPLHFYSSFILERKFNLSKQPIPDWIKDDVKKGLLSFGVFLIFIQTLYLFLRNFPATWWAWMAVFWVFVSVILARIVPVFIIPLFFKYYPISGELKEGVIKLSAACGIKIIDVYKIDFSKKTNKLNAAVVGLGKSRRVILADNLIACFTIDEVKGVLAHEFGHHKMLHMWKLLAFGALSAFCSFYALYLVSSRIAIWFGTENIYDIAIFPAFMLVLFLTGFLITPLQNGFSRKLERQADLFALKATQNKSAFISLMGKLAEKNLSDPNPAKIIKFLFYDHPPISERIKLAKDF